MQSEEAMNSTVEFWTSGLLCGSPYDLVTGLYMNSSGTEQELKWHKTLRLQSSSKEIAGTIYKQLDWTCTIIDPVTQVALPPALVQKGDERIDVGAAGATAHDRV